MDKLVLPVWVYLTCCMLNVNAAIRLRGIYQYDKEEHLILELDNTGRYERSITDVFPPVINVNFNSSYGKINLKLQRNKNLLENVPVCSEHGCKNLLPSDHGTQNTAFYQDYKYGAAFIVEVNNGYISDMFGSVYIKGLEHVIEKTTPAHHGYPCHGKEFRLLKSTVQSDRIADYVVKDKYTFKMKMNPQTNTKLRRKRAAPHYNVELLIVTDYSVYLFWFEKSTASSAVQKGLDAKAAIRQFYAFVINGMDVKYQFANNSIFFISVVFAGIYISDKSSTSPFTENFKKVVNSKTEVNSKKVLDSFEIWLTTTSGLPENDHAMLFTKYDMATESAGNNNVGLATLSAICRVDSASVVEDSFTTNMITTAAHELGHSLGAAHDGDTDRTNGNTCKSSDGYIMSSGGVPTGDKILNTWKFSSCSMTYFKNLLDKLNRDKNCLSTLSKTFDPAALSAYKNQIPGQVYPVDTQCRYAGKYPFSKLCRGFYDDDYSTICTSLYCSTDQKALHCNIFQALEGTTCGNKKWCEKGRCVSSTDAPSAVDNCPFGDTEGIVLSQEQLTCASLLKKSKYNCALGWNKKCCASCNAAYTGIKGCEYGDKVLNCVREGCGNADDKYNQDCCETCAPPTTTTTTVTTKSSVVNTTIGPKSEGSTGWIVAIGVSAGGLVVIAAVVGAVCVYCRKMKTNTMSDSKGVVNQAFTVTNRVDFSSMSGGIANIEKFPRPSRPPPRPVHVQAPSSNSTVDTKSRILRPPTVAAKPHPLPKLSNSSLQAKSPEDKALSTNNVHRLHSENVKKRQPPPRPNFPPKYSNKLNEQSSGSGASVVLSTQNSHQNLKSVNQIGRIYNKDITHNDTKQSIVSLPYETLNLNDQSSQPSYLSLAEVDSEVYDDVYVQHNDSETIQDSSSCDIDGPTPLVVKLSAVVAEQCALINKNQSIDLRAQHPDDKSQMTSSSEHFLKSKSERVNSKGKQPPPRPQHPPRFSDKQRLHVSSLQQRPPSSEKLRQISRDENRSKEIISSPYQALSFTDQSSQSEYLSISDIYDG